MPGHAERAPQIARKNEEHSHHCIAEKMAIVSRRMSMRASSQPGKSDSNALNENALGQPTETSVARACAIVRDSGDSLSSLREASSCDLLRGRGFALAADLRDRF